MYAVNWPTLQIYVGWLVSGLFIKIEAAVIFWKVWFNIYVLTKDQSSTHLNYFGESDCKKIAPVCCDLKQLLLHFCWKRALTFNLYFLKWIWKSTSLTSYTCRLTPTMSLLVKVEVLLFKHLFTWRPCLYWGCSEVLHLGFVFVL